MGLIFSSDIAPEGEEVRVPLCEEEQMLSIEDQRRRIAAEGAPRLHVFQRVANRSRAKDPRSRLLYGDERHIRGHNFSGPGTHIHDRWVRETPPFNEVDACSREHDIVYYQVARKEGMEAAERRRLFREADKRARVCYDRHPRDRGYEVARAMLRGKRAIEQNAPRVVSSRILGDYSAAV